MTRITCVSGPDLGSPEPCLVEVLPARGFVPTGLAAAFDCFRIANRVAGRDIFLMRLVSVGTERMLASLGGIEVSVVPMAELSSPPDILIGTGGAGMARATLQFLPRLQRVRHAGARGRLTRSRGG